MKEVIFHFHILSKILLSLFKIIINIYNHNPFHELMVNYSVCILLLIIMMFFEVLGLLPSFCFPSSDFFFTIK